MAFTPPPLPPSTRLMVEGGGGRGREGKTNLYPPPVELMCFFSFSILDYFAVSQLALTWQKQKHPVLRRYK